MQIERKKGEILDGVRAMRHSAAALAGVAPSPSTRSRPSAPAAIASGPSEHFIRRTRNPDLKSPARFLATVKREGDVIL